MSAPTKPRRGRPPGAPARPRELPTGTVAALAAILAGVPKFDGRAACRDHVGTFDAAAEGDPAAVGAALEICQRCPIREQCRQWAERTPPHRREAAVVGGQYVSAKRHRKDGR